LLSQYEFLSFFATLGFCQKLRYQDIFLPLFVLNCEKRRKGAPFMSERESVDSERMSWLKMSAPIEVDWAPPMNGS